MPPIEAALLGGDRRQPLHPLRLGGGKSSASAATRTAAQRRLAGGNTKIIEQPPHLLHISVRGEIGSNDAMRWAQAR